MCGPIITLLSSFSFLVGLALFCSLVRKGLFVTGILLFPVLFTGSAAFAAEPFCDITAICISAVLLVRFMPNC